MTPFDRVTPFDHVTPFDRVTPFDHMTLSGAVVPGQSKFLTRLDTNCGKYGVPASWL